MTIIALGNALRASNIINLTFYEFEAAVPEPDYENGMSFRSANYKTSLLYGEKIILLPKECYQRMKFFVYHLRKQFIDDGHLKSHERRIFTSSRGNKETITDSNISQGITSAFEKSGVLTNEGLYIYHYYYCYFISFCLIFYIMLQFEISRLNNID